MYADITVKTTLTTAFIPFQMALNTTATPLNIAFHIATYILIYAAIPEITAITTGLIPCQTCFMKFPIALKIAFTPFLNHKHLL